MSSPHRIDVHQHVVPRFGRKSSPRMAAIPQAPSFLNGPLQSAVDFMDSREICS
jgi:hypothetical protein